MKTLKSKTLVVDEQIDVECCAVHLSMLNICTLDLTVRSCLSHARSVSPKVRPICACSYPQIAEELPEIVTGTGTSLFTFFQADRISLRAPVQDTLRSYDPDLGQMLNPINRHLFLRKLDNACFTSFVSQRGLELRTVLLATTFWTCATEILSIR